MERGDVVKVRLPAPLGPPGREQIGERPAIVVQTGSSHANLSTVLIVPLTSQHKALQFSGSFEMAPTKGNGLSMNSVVLTHQLRAIDKNRILDVIGCISPSDLQRLETELRNLLGL